MELTVSPLTSHNPVSVGEKNPSSYDPMISLKDTEISESNGTTRDSVVLTKAGTQVKAGFVIFRRQWTKVMVVFREQR